MIYVHGDDRGGPGNSGDFHVPRGLVRDSSLTTGWPVRLGAGKGGRESHPIFVDHSPTSGTDDKTDETDGREATGRDPGVPTSHLWGSLYSKQAELTQTGPISWSGTKRGSRG